MSIPKHIKEHIQLGLRPTSDVFNVKSYGATGDGTTDDSIAIQSALDACGAAGGGIVYLPTGTYLIGTGTNTGQALSTLNLGANAANNDTVTIGSKTYTFQTSLTDVDGNVLIGASASDTIDNFIAAINLAAGAGSTYAASMTANSDTVVAGTGGGDTMRIEVADAGAIATTETGANMNWTSTVALIKGGLQVYDNTLICGDGWSSIIKISTENFTGYQKMNFFINKDYINGNSNIVIRDLYLDGNQTARAVAGASAATENEGIDWYLVTDCILENLYLTDVTHDSVDVDDCEDVLINNCMFKTPSAQAANVGDGVHSTCDYLTVTNCQFEYIGVGRIAADNEEAAINVAGQNCVVSNNSFIGCARAVYATTGARDCTITGNSIYKCYHGGIVLLAGQQIAVNGNVIDTVNTGGGGDDEDKYAIYTVVSYTTITNNSIIGGYGVKAATVTNGVVIADNYMNTTLTGVEVTCTGLTQITGNKIQGGATLYGVRVTGGQASVSNNVIDSRPHATTRGAIDISTAGCSVSGNVITGASASDVGCGILVTGDDCSVFGNVISGTGAADADIYLKGADSIAFGNRTMGAGTAGIRAATTATNVVIYGNNGTDSSDGVLDDGATNPQISAATGAASNINV